MSEQELARRIEQGRRLAIWMARYRQAIACGFCLEDARDHATAEVAWRINRQKTRQTDPPAQA